MPLCPICGEPVAIATGARSDQRRLLKTCGSESCHREQIRRAGWAGPNRLPRRSAESRERTRRALLDRPGVTAVCKRCGAPYRKQLGSKNYCSVECRSKRHTPVGRPTITECCTCGITFAVGRYGPVARCCDPRCAVVDDTARKYGMNGADYLAMVIGQAGRCALGCGRWASRIDHDHASGRVRGLLCNSCNRALGVVAETPEQLRELASYLSVRPASVQLVRPPSVRPAATEAG